MSLRPLLTLCAALALVDSPSIAAEVVVQNDSTAGGVPSTVANLFLAGESTASTLTATCDGDIVAARIYWASQLGGAPPQLEQMISIFGAGTFPTPGAVLQNQGAVPAVIATPTLIDGVMNEFRFLDPPADTVPLSVPVSQGQAFVVSLQFFNQSSGNPFAPSVVYDQDGCLAATNAVDVIPGGWNDACPLGVTGDWVIRAVIDCDEDPPPSALPSLGGPMGAALLAMVLLGAGWAIQHRTRLRPAAGPRAGASTPRGTCRP